MSKFRIISFIALIAAFAAMAVDMPEPRPCPFEPTDEEIALAYHEDPVTHDITFLFEPTRWRQKFDNIESLRLSGTFNLWAHTDWRYLMVPDTLRQIFHLTVPYVKAKAPGNIGQPEFRFMVNESYVTVPASHPADHVYTSAGARKMLVMFDWDDPEEITDIITESRVVRKIEEFDLDTEEGRREISNYRTVPGTDILHRSYHPFKSTRRTYMGAEPERLLNVKRFAEGDKIVADICLSGNDTENLGTYTVNSVVYQETIPDFYQDIIDADRVLYVGEDYHRPGYYEVYYYSDEEYFHRWIKDIVDFINRDDIQGHFLIHCQLGTDRTGVLCAIISALCDATWEEIVEDYEKSNRMGINEYRHHKLLRHSLEKFLGVEYLSDVPSLPEAVQNHLIDNGWLAKEDIAKLKNKLSGLTDGIVSAKWSESSAPAEYFTLQGIRVERPTERGLYIVRRGSSVSKQMVR